MYIWTWEIYVGRQPRKSFVLLCKVGICTQKRKKSIRYSKNAYIMDEVQNRKERRRNFYLLYFSAWQLPGNSSIKMIVMTLSCMISFCVFLQKRVLNILQVGKKRGKKYTRNGRALRVTIYLFGNHRACETFFTFWALFPLFIIYLS